MSGATMNLDLTRAANAHALDFDRSALSDDERELAIATWQQRMHNEHVSARVFAALIPQLMRAGINDGRLSAVAAMIEEELGHARLCAAAVTALGGTAVVALGELAEVPRHDDAEPVEALLRNVISIACVSETIAVAQIEAEHEAAGPPPLRAILRSILADEVGHARFGWKLLDDLMPEVDAPTRSRLSRYLERVFASTIAHQLSHGGDPSALRSKAGQEVGLCDGALQRRIFVDTVRAVIVPALEAHGLAAGHAWRRASEAARSAAPAA
jgi:hypothetical protein